MIKAEPLLRVTNLTVAYGKRATVLNDIHFTLPTSGRVALIGESGCGKTTLARAVMGLVVPQTGTLQFQDRNGNLITNPDRQKKAGLVQMIFQDPYQSLNPRHTVARTLAEALSISGINPETSLVQRSEKLLESVGLDATALHRYPHQFSGGQRQRISIARALAPSPRLLICDEAVSALDVTTQARVVRLLVQLSQSLDLSLFFISHDLPLVHNFCDYLMVMEGGKIVESGPTRDVLREPKASKTKELIDSVIAL